MAAIDEGKQASAELLHQETKPLKEEEEPQGVESEKLILEAISSEKLPLDGSSSPAGSPELADEETESTRDSNSTERETGNESDNLEEKEGSELKEEWQDILGSGVIMKKVLKEGQPDSRPSRSSRCVINYTCKLEEAHEDDFADVADNYELGLGEGDVVQGLDVALGLMNSSERCLLKIGPRLAFGDRGLPPKIPAGATVLFDVELVSHQPDTECEELSVQERQKIGNKKRERGNWWYQRGENTLAVQCYRRALDYLDEVESENPEHEKPTDAELQRLLEDRLKVLNNMASAQIKMQLYDQALTSLQTVLRCQPDNVKALFRKAKIHSAKNDLPQALRLLEKARTLEPEDPHIAKEIATATAQINKQKNSEREYARRMFGNNSASSTGKKAPENTEKSANTRVPVWVTLGASVALGLAGIVAYKFKYA